LRAIFNAAVRAGRIRQSPCVQIELPRVRHAEMQFLTAPEVSALAAQSSYLSPAQRLRWDRLAGLPVG
jgi:hypothetical protein